MHNKTDRFKRLKIPWDDMDGCAVGMHSTNIGGLFCIILIIRFPRCICVSNLAPHSNIYTRQDQRSMYVHRNIASKK